MTAPAQTTAAVLVVPDDADAAPVVVHSQLVTSPADLMALFALYESTVGDTDASAVAVLRFTTRGVK